MIDGDFRSLVHTVKFEPWRVHEIVTALLEANTIEQGVHLRYACDALKHRPIRPGHVLSLGELIAWVLSGAGLGVDTVLPPLAWAVVMTPYKPPDMGYLGFVLWSRTKPEKDTIYWQVRGNPSWRYADSMCIGNPYKCPRGRMLVEHGPKFVESAGHAAFYHAEVSK